MGFVDSLKTGLKKTREALFMDVETLFSGKAVTEETIEAFEEILFTSDIGVKSTTEIIEGLKEEYKAGKIKKTDDIKVFLKNTMTAILGMPQPFVLYRERPFVVFCLGVNGVGKTTTIGKLAMKAVSEGHSVILAAADTFRAAAIEQLDVWATRAGASIVKHQHGSDPAAVAYDAVEAAKARGIDLVIVDTAGRLHTKTHLMEELKKIKRVIGKSVPGAPHETLLVLDATTGQNALSQAKLFNEAVGITGIALTKMDGTSKGGIVLAIKKELNIPIRLIGVGEKIGDYQDFIPGEFASALFD
ncbi:MAG: signal recognition particle-docking protein FtsY [Nitrospirae bacterium]|nr:signal recognition particle-docking protein FtsY [Nitrospirota bacterium]MBF0536091.1 signal recognition particle-docking protein FtsY [Nitrospirota bacterium]MBF0617948.1 signal recognition particle-docking protein FtsY [Nitrospirota bacterium]